MAASVGFASSGVIEPLGPPTSFPIRRPRCAHRPRPFWWLRSALGGGGDLGGPVRPQAAARIAPAGWSGLVGFGRVWSVSGDFGFQGCLGNARASPRLSAVAFAPAAPCPPSPPIRAWAVRATRPHEPVHPKIGAARV